MTPFADHDRMFPVIVKVYSQGSSSLIKWLEHRFSRPSLDSVPPATGYGDTVGPVGNAIDLILVSQEVVDSVRQLDRAKKGRIRTALGRNAARRMHIIAAGPLRRTGSFVSLIGLAEPGFARVEIIRARICIGLQGDSSAQLARTVFHTYAHISSQASPTS